MANFYDDVLFIVFAVGITILFFRSEMFREAIETFRDTFRGGRGGPPTPMHPCPAGDDTHLRPNSRKPAARK